MASKTKSVLEWISFFMGATGMGFLLTSMFMPIFRIGRNPLLASFLGIVLIVLATILMEFVAEKCPRCGSRLVENGRCLVCDYTYSGILSSEDSVNGQK